MTTCGPDLQMAVSRGMVKGMSDTLTPGSPAPAFAGIAVGGTYGEGTPVSSADFKGQTVVLYFYPKDDTPGCTAQACALRDHYGHFLKTGAKIFGVSVDSPESHLKFIAKHALPFPLISDEEKKIVQAYAVWGEKSFAGKTFMGTERSTFVISPDGRIKSVFRKVKPEEHTDTLMEDLRHFEP